MTFTKNETSCTHENVGLCDDCGKPMCKDCGAACHCDHSDQKKA